MLKPLTSYFSDQSVSVYSRVAIKVSQHECTLNSRNGDAVGVTREKKFTSLVPLSVGNKREQKQTVCLGFIMLGH